MAQSSGERQTFWFGLAAPLLVGIFLGLRAERGVDMVLTTHPGGAAAVASGEEGKAAQALLAELDAKAARIEQVTLADRDPFREPAPPRITEATAPSVAPKPAPGSKKPVPPVLGALLYDEVRPSVQLRVGALTSDWLHKGESFQDWTVVEIRPGAVTVSQDGKTVVLRPS